MNNGTTPAIWGMEALKKKMEMIYTDTSINNPSLTVYELIAHCLDTHAITQEEFLEAFQKDNNLINLTIAELLVEHGYISNFSSFGFEETELYPLLSANPCILRSSSFPIEVSEGKKTEVYFWGLPNSGITTLLAAILNVASNGSYARSMSMNPNCHSFEYMAHLARIVKSSNQISVFPRDAGWNNTNSICLDFDLEDNRRAIHPISFIQMASATFEVVLKKESGYTLSSDVEHYIDDLMAILTSKRTRNKKIHFFIIEYNKDPREYIGLPQRAYIEATLNYLEKRSVFKTDTDRLVLLITKVDRAKENVKQLQDVLKEYISEHYLGFYNHLRKISQEHEINGGIVEICPFSVGQVFFQDYFHFDEKYAANLVSRLLEETGKRQNSWLDRIKDRLKGGA